MPLESFVPGGNVRVGRAAVDAELDVNSDRSVFDGNAADDNLSAAVNRNAVCHARAVDNTALEEPVAPVAFGIVGL